MTELFYTILNMSISASIFIFVVLLLRLFFRKAPKWVSVLLWGLVAIRLLLPFVPESALSLMPKAEWVTQNTFYPEENTFFDSIPADRIKVDAGMGKDVVYYYKVVEPPIEIHRGVSPVFVLSCIWLAGVAAMLVYMLVSYIRVMRCVRGAKQFRGNIYTSESVSSPFVLGLIRPRIYLPENMDAVSMSYVIAHEEAHLRRFDHLWKPFGFLLLAVHWFNPLIWIGYILLCRDIEMACDERVVRGMNEEERADYSEALLECSVNRKIISACPLAFGEIGAKARIKIVLNYKKPAFWIVVLAVIASVTAAVCFLTNPMNKPAISIDDHDWYFERVLIKKLEKNTTIEGYQPGLQPKTDNAMPVNAVLLPDGEPMWYQLITGDLNTTRFGNHFILEEADSKSAHYSVELYRDTGELYSGVTSKAVIEPMKYGDGYVLTIYEYSVGSEKEIIFTTKKQPGAAQGQKKLTMEDVLTLSEKKTALTWEDFAEYAYTDEGAGVFRCIYEIDDSFGLEITGGSMHGTPMHIYLCAYREDGADYIDIRDPYEDIEEFLERHNYSPSVVLASHISKAQLDHEELKQQLEEIEAHIHAVVNAEIILEYQRKFSSVVCHPDANYVTVYVRDFTEDDILRFEKVFENYSYVLVSADAPLNDNKEVLFPFGEPEPSKPKTDLTLPQNIIDASYEMASRNGFVDVEKTGYIIRLTDKDDANTVEIVFATLDPDVHIGIIWTCANPEAAWELFPGTPMMIYDRARFDHPLTLEDVIKLSHKGYDLTWEDFAGFHYTETGSGLYIRVYEVDENFKVWIGGGSPTGTPMYIYLALADDLDTRIDIRDGGVEEFMERHIYSPPMTDEPIMYLPEPSVDGDSETNETAERFVDNSIVNTVMGFVKAHITKIDTGLDGGKYANVDDNLQTYLSDKEDAAEITVPKNHYHLDISVNDYQDKDTVIYLQLNLKARWNYVEDIDSGYSKLIEVLVDKENGKIIDIYDRTNLFDIAVRGDTLDLSESSVGISPEITRTAKQTYLQSQSNADTASPMH